jgi:peptide chain release factor subunit 1
LYWILALVYVFSLLTTGFFFRFGFIVMDGNGALFGTLQGNTREVLHKFTVDLPKKHGRGGQSALRFARLRMEKRHNYVRKVAETAVTHFIANDRPNVSGK